MATLKAAGIGTSLHFIPIYNHPYYQSTYHYNRDDTRWPMRYDRSLSLPIFPDMSMDDVNTIVDTVLANV